MILEGFGERLRGRAGGSAQRGFSLLEVVVAFAILALSLGVLIQIFSQAINTTALSATYSRAATLAEARLADVGLEIPLEPGVHTGEDEDGFQWQVFVDYYELGEVLWEPVLEPYLVTSVVSWDTARGTRQVSLSSLRLGEKL
jgi:general secretion pathway protein I